MGGLKRGNAAAKTERKKMVAASALAQYKPYASMRYEWRLVMIKIIAMPKNIPERMETTAGMEGKVVHANQNMPMGDNTAPTMAAYKRASGTVLPPPFFIALQYKRFCIGVVAIAIHCPTAIPKNASPPSPGVKCRCS